MSGKGKHSGLAWFVGMILLIVAFAKGQWRDILLMATFGVWGIAFAGYLIVHALRNRKRKEKERRHADMGTPFLSIMLLAMALFFVWCFVDEYIKWTIALLGLWTIYFAGTLAIERKNEILAALRQAREKWRSPDSDTVSVETKAAPNIDIDNSEPIGIVLLRHAAYRISNYLQSAYPDAYWEWETPLPEREHTVAKGGVIRIRVEGVPDYNKADVEFEPSGRMSIKLLREISLADCIPQPEKDPEPVSCEDKEDTYKESQVFIDVNAWYSIQGKFIREMAADFQSHGYKGFFIEENGTVGVDSNGKTEPKEKLRYFPPKKVWPSLARLVEEDGLSATTMTDKFVVNF